MREVAGCKIQINVPLNSDGFRPATSQRVPGGRRSTQMLRSPFLLVTWNLMGLCGVGLHLGCHRPVVEAVVMEEINPASPPMVCGYSGSSLQLTYGTSFY